MAVNTNFLTSELTLDHYDDWLKGNLSKSKAHISTVVKSKTCGKPLDRKSLEPVKSPVRSIIPPHQSYSEVERTDYALEYQAAEKRKLTEESQMHDLNAFTFEGALNQLEEDSGVTEMCNNIKDNLRLSADVYEGFTFNHSPTILPIEEHKNKILNTVESNQVTVIQGPTGSGKTTQVPQFILDHYASKNQYCNIVVTQPRRIAAISIAKRICQERRWKLGTFCGYQVGMDREISPNTRLTYMTTGVLLQKLINKKDINDYTHVILDEIHERDQETDFCILIVRKFLRSISKAIRVILMSATLDSEMFANYFALPVRNTLDPAPIITIDGSFYSVSEYYVEDLIPLGTIGPLDPDNPHISNDAQQLAVNLIQHFDTFEAKEQGKDHHSGHLICGSVLIFLPGLSDIDKLYDKLRTLPGHHRLVVIPLHSSVTIEEQTKVFQPTSPGYRKVILSTNIAESSITVPDIKYVIDFCLTKNLMCDTQTNFTSLQLDWASKANCIQRKGRAGRVSNGRVYRLITRSFWNNHIPEYNTPEMQRCPLDLLVLRTKILDLGEPKAILALALAPPNLDDIERTILDLKEIGALALTLNGVPNRYDADLTYMGRVIASLPTDIRIGKLLVWGHVFGFLKECLILAAALSLKSVISRPYKKHLESYQRKFSWADGSFSDCIAIVNIYKVWERNWAHGIFKRRGQSEVEWGKANFVQIKRLHEVAELIRELEFRLKQFNLRIPIKAPESKKDLNHPEEKLLFKMIICGAFYPNYFIRDKIDEAQVMKTISGKDPFNVVMINGLPPNQGSLYKSQIEQLFYPCGNILAIHMEESKIFIEFARHYSMNRTLNNVIGMGNTGIVNPAVYLALKMKKILHRSLELEQYSKETATKLMKQVSQAQSNVAGKLQMLRTNRITAAADTIGKQVDLPNYSMSVIQIMVTEVLECGHFWARYVDQENSLYFVQSSLNMNPQDLQPISGNVYVGMICAAPYKDEEVNFYRAQVEAIHNNMAHVFFVDYGNMESVPFHNLKLLPQNLLDVPFQAFECYLSEIQPSPIKCFDGCWSQESTNYFQNTVSGSPIYAQIYSVVGRILHVELIKKTSKQQENINQKLIDLGYADVTEESFLSKKNHEERKKAQESSSLSVCHNSDSASLDWNTLGLPNEFGSVRCVGKIKLHGPSNPLEMSFSGMTNSGRLRGAKIDSDSVNCVTIDDSPQNSAARMMVAAFVHMNASGMNVITRDTTLMPHIAGLPALVAMLFTPYCELRTDKNMTYYTGAICGLGFDSETGVAIYPEHDMEIEFDSKIDLDDIFKINGIRLAINIIIGNQQTARTWGPESVVKLQESARKKLLDLMKKRREPIEPLPAWCPYEWNLISPSDYLKPDCSDNNWELLFKLHKGVALSSECSSSVNDDEEDNCFANERDISELENHIQELKVISRMSSYSNVIRCKLCKETFPSPKILSMHISSQRHLKKEASVLGGAI